MLKQRVNLVVERNRRINDVKISGKKILLRSVTENDVTGNWWKWLNDPSVTQYMAKGNRINTKKRQLDFFKKVSGSGKDCVLAICDIKTNSHIGTVGIHSIDWTKGIGQFGIIIGEKEFWGKGIGTEAWFLAINYGFTYLNLKRINTKIFVKNLASLKIAKKVGFIERILLKDDVLKNGISYDRKLLEILKENWIKKN